MGLTSLFLFTLLGVWLRAHTCSTPASTASAKAIDLGLCRLSSSFCSPSALSPRQLTSIAFRAPSRRFGGTVNFGSGMIWEVAIAGVCS